MTANELRIGSIIDFDGMKSIVKEIDNQGVVVFIKETDETEWIDLFQFTPITLTEEILLKSGFEITKNDEYPFKYVINKGMRNEVEIEDLNSTTCFVLSHGRRFSVVKIKHLHQLQNLYFALTGTELKIEL